MLQDIAPHVLNNHFENRSPRPDDIVMCFDGRDMYVRTAALPVLDYPRMKEFRVPPRTSYGFDVDGTWFFMPVGEYTVPEGFEKKSLRTVRDDEPKEYAFAAMTAYHLYLFHMDHRFCGCCGKPTRPDIYEQALRCTGCNRVIYPDIHPAVNVAITDGDRLLMVRHTKSPMFPFALVAGFCEFGETAEQTVRREVMEEVGLKVGKLHACGSQPWGIAGNLQIGFFAELEGSDEPHPDPREICEAKWFDREDIPRELSASSITGAMKEAFRLGKEKEMWI